jgi:hypothetical protein
MQEDLGNIDLSALIAEWVPIAGLEARFGFSKSTSYRLVAEELVEARKVGARTLVNLTNVRRYLANQPLPNIKADERSARLAAGPARRERDAVEVSRTDVE